MKELQQAFNQEDRQVIYEILLDTFKGEPIAATIQAWQQADQPTAWQQADQPTAWQQWQEAFTDLALDGLRYLGFFISACAVIVTVTKSSMPPIDNDFQRMVLLYLTTAFIFRFMYAGGVKLIHWLNRLKKPRLERV